MPLRAFFERGGLCQSHHAVLARAVRGGPGGTHQAGDGRHVDDGSATALLEHLLNFVLQAKPGAFEVDVDGAVPVFFGLFGDGDPVPLDPGIIERHIQAPKLLHRFLDQRTNFGRLRYVGLHEQAIAASPPCRKRSFSRFTCRVLSCSNSAALAHASRPLTHSEITATLCNSF